MTTGAQELIVAGYRETRNPALAHEYTPGVSNLNVGRYEYRGERPTRQDFTVGTGQLTLASAELIRSGITPEWMRWGGVSSKDLMELSAHVGTYQRFHGSLEMVLDGVGGFRQGEKGAVNGGMLLLYGYHREIMNRGSNISGRAEYDEILRQQAEKVSQLLHQRSQGEAKATLVADINVDHQQSVSWAGDSDATYYDAKGKIIWKSQPHKGYPGVRGMENVISSCLGEAAIRHWGQKYLGDIGKNTLVLNTDGVNVADRKVWSIIKRHGVDLTSAAKEIASLSNKLDNRAIRIIQEIQVGWDERKTGSGAKEGLLETLMGWSAKNTSEEAVMMALRAASGFSLGLILAGGDVPLSALIAVGAAIGPKLVKK